MNYPSFFVLSLLFFTATASMKSHSSIPNKYEPAVVESFLNSDFNSETVLASRRTWRSASSRKASSKLKSPLRTNVATFINKKQSSSAPTQATNPKPPRRRRRNRRGYQTYKGLDFTLAYGFNYFEDSYEFREETPFTDALSTSFTPTVGRAFSAKIEVPVGKHFRFGTGVDFLSKKRKFSAPVGVEIGNQVNGRQHHRTVQLPLYAAFDQRIRHFSIGIGVGAALQVFQHTSGARLFEDLTAAQVEMTAGNDYYNNSLTFRAFTELRGEYRPTDDFGIVARIGYQFEGPNELGFNQDLGTLKTASFQVKIGVNYVLFCDSSRR
jgi:hypothetical protein